jgi:hypothetical protein
MNGIKSKFLSYCLIYIIPSLLQAVEINYAETTTSFPNPERGWYAYTLMLDNGNNYQQLANTGFRLVYSSIVLDGFVDRDIDINTLNTINNRFKEIRNAGLKAVLRVNYSESLAGSYPNLDRIERHMQQLSPVLNDNKDVIAFIEAGYMGPWGEWHFWNIDNPPFPDNESSWRQLTDLLLENKPSDRFIMLRYPSKKQQIFDGRTITSDNAFSNEDIARIGHHNDCFVSSSNDVGTYQPHQTEYSSSIESLKNYLKHDTTYSPMGGETCSVHSRNACSTTISEMEDFHWTYMNNGYHQGVLSSWRSEGCYDEIDIRLGYRLSLIRTEIPDTLIAGSDNNIIIDITNTGFARPWYFRTPYIRYIQGEEIVGQVPLANMDIRALAPQESRQIIVTTKVPANLNGNFDIALWFPDPNEANHSDHRFSIRLANENVWDAQHGHNIIARGIQISNSIANSPPSPPSLN